MQNQYEYYSSSSGLTPAAAYSYNDHYLAWLKLQTGRTTGTVNDLQALLFGSSEKAWYQAKLGTVIPNISLSDVKALFYATGAMPQPKRAIFGNSGPAIPGANTLLTATWMSGDSWQNVQNADYLYANTGYQSQLVAHPDWSVALGVCFFPYKLARSQWDAMCDAIVSDTPVSVGGTMTAPSAIYASLGKKLVAQTPTAGTTFARMNWEMNINPGGTDAVTPSKWAAAYNVATVAVRNSFNAEAARLGRPKQKILFDFSPISDGYDFKGYYPGDTNVDVISMDIYASKYGTTIPDKPTLLSWTGGFLKAIADFAVLHGKPVALGEWGNWQPGTSGQTNSHGRGDFPEYIDQVFDWAEAQAQPTANPQGVAYLSYYNINDSNNTGQNFGDTPDSLARYQLRSGGVLSPWPLSTTTAVSITGGAPLGSVLTVVPGVWNYGPDDVKYQWTADGSPISGATGTTYTTQAADVGKSVAVVATATKAKYSAGTSVSNNITVAPAGQTSFVQDTFTDTAGTNIGSHTGEIGATYTRATGTPTGSTGITADNRLRKRSTVTETWLASGLPASPDYTVEHDVALMAAQANSASSTVFGRANAAGNSYYGMGLAVASGVPSIRLLKNVGGTTTVLGTVDISANAYARWYHLKMVMNGTTLEGWVDGVKLWSVTDTSITIAGQVGFVVYAQSVDTATDMGIYLDTLLARSN